MTLRRSSDAYGQKKDRLLQQTASRKTRQKGISMTDYSTAISIFHDQEFGEIRAVTIDGEPWFVANDICRAFGETNRNRAMQNLFEDEKGYTQMDTPGGNQKLSIVNESGLYSMLFAMQPLKARGVSDDYITSRTAQLNHFKRWITHDVLPAIRKTGGYIAATPDMTPAQIMAQALKIADATLAERDKQIADLKPKAFFADSVANSDSLILVRDLAKILNQSGYKTGGNRLYEQLRHDGYLVAGNSSDRNMPTQRAAELGLFRVVESTITTPDGEAIISRTAKVTGKGQQYFVKRYCGGAS